MASRMGHSRDAPITTRTHHFDKPPVYVLHPRKSQYVGGDCRPLPRSAILKGGCSDERALSRRDRPVRRNFAPRGWAFCQGQILSIAQNTALFSLLGTTYGGNGQT